MPGPKVGALYGGGSLVLANKPYLFNNPMVILV